MRIAVVGAGLAGLTFAGWLGRHGIESTVYENADVLTEAGAGLQLSPNSVRLLHRLGLARTLARCAVQPASLDVRRWDDGSVLARTELGYACEELYAAPYYTLLRADLLRCLQEFVLRRTGTTIRLGRRVVRVSQSDREATLHFSDGTTVAADLVVGADGIHSAVRAQLTRDDARYSGTTVYRGLVPLDAGPATRPRVNIWLGPGQHCVWYPVARGRYLNVVATRPEPEWYGRSWQAPGAVSDLVAAYAGWHPEVVDVLSAAPSVTRWALHDRAALDRWYQGRVTVIGDAAHPVLPFGAQGANQAIESAVALAACLLSAGLELPAALAAYQRIRAPRLAQVVDAVRRNAADHHLADGAGQAGRDRRLPARARLRAQAWLFGHDAERSVSPVRQPRELRPAGDAELPEDRLEVVRDGVLGDVEQTRDLRVGAALADEAGDLPLPLGQVGPGRRPGRALVLWSGGACAGRR
jgi:salicylate hydroxylase